MTASSASALDRLIRYQAQVSRIHPALASRALRVQPPIDGTPKMATVDADSAVAIAAEFFACAYLPLAAAASRILTSHSARQHTGRSGFSAGGDQIARSYHHGYAPSFCHSRLTRAEKAVVEHLRKAESRGNSLYRSIRQSAAQADRGTVLNPATPKDAQSQSRVMAEYGKVEQLQEEKIALAEKLARIVTRHRERARDEWRKIVGDEAVQAWDTAQEDEVAKESTGQVGLSAIAYQLARMPSGGSVAQVMAQLVQKGGLTSGMASPSMDEKIIKSPSSPHAWRTRLTTSPFHARPAERKAGTTTPGSGYFDVPATSRTQASAVNPASGISSPHPLATAYTPQTASHPAHKEKKSRRIASETPDAFAEAEVAPLEHLVEPEAADAADADDTLYCFCQEKSHGQMIGCDNSACRFEWVRSRYALHSLDILANFCASVPRQVHEARSRQVARHLVLPRVRQDSRFHE